MHRTRAQVLHNFSLTDKRARKCFEAAKGASAPPPSPLAMMEAFDPKRLKEIMAARMQEDDVRTAGFVLVG